MARGSKASYSGKQRRKAHKIERGYRKRGASSERAKRIAYATVNKESGGGKKSGSGRGRKTSHVSSRKGGKVGGKSVSHRKRVQAGRKAARTRKHG